MLLQVHGQVFDDVVSVAEVSSLAGDDGVLHLLLQLNVLVIPDRHWRGRFGSPRRNNQVRPRSHGLLNGNMVVGQNQDHLQFFHSVFHLFLITF